LDLPDNYFWVTILQSHTLTELEEKMITLDLKTELKYLYNPSAKQVELVDVPANPFLLIDGRIEPGLGPGSSPEFQEAMQALYGTAYTLKFMAKKRKLDPVDYPVMALEGLWWVEDGQFHITRKDNWVYTLMILQPGVITPEMFAEALVQQRKKKGHLPVFEKLRLEIFQEGLCVQMLHLGPYITEPATVEKMEHFAIQNGYQLCGKHHEIYLGNPLRAEPDRLKTILRHPVRKV
jgi:hypothetical protein